MADERVNLNVNLDFTSNLASIQKQLKTIIDGIEADNLEVSLGEQSKKELLNDVKTLSNAITQSFNSTTQKINFNNVRKELGSAGVSAAALTQKLQLIGVTGESAFNTLNSSVYSFEKRLKSTNKLYNKFMAVLTNVTSYNAVSAIWNTAVGSIERAIGFTKDLDQSLNDIRIVSGASADEMARFAKQANESAKVLKTSTTEYADAALVYFQQGMEADDVKKMTDATIMGANIVGESTEEMSELLTAVMNGYKLAADDAITVTDKLAAVGADTAADFYELATGMSKVASMANTAGVDIDRLNAQLATIVSTTKEAPETIGTSLRTIYARMLAFKNNQTDLMTDEDGELFDMPSVESALEKYSKATGTQVSLFDTAADGTKTMRDLGDVIDDIGNSWDKTSNLAVKFGLATSLAGKQQQNRLIALFDSWDEYQEAVQTSLGSEGTTLQQNETYMDSYAAHAKEMQASMESLYMTLFQSDDMIGVVDVITTIITGLTKITDLLGGLPGILSVIIGFASKPALNKLFSKNSGSGSKELSGLYQDIDKVKDNEGLKKSVQNHEKEFQTYRDKLAKISKVYGEEEGKRVTELAQKYIDLRTEIEQTKVKQKYFEETQTQNYEKTKKTAQESGMTDAFSVYKLDDKIDRELLEDTFSRAVSDITANSNNGQLSVKKQNAVNDFQAAIEDSSLSVEELREKYNNFLNIVQKTPKIFEASKQSLDTVFKVLNSSSFDINNMRGKFDKFKKSFKDDDTIQGFFTEFDNLLKADVLSVEDLKSEWGELIQKIADYKAEKETGVDADVLTVDVEQDLTPKAKQAKEDANKAIEPEAKRAELIDAISAAISTAIPLVVGFNSAFEEGTTITEKLASGLTVLVSSVLENVDAFSESAGRVFADTKLKLENGEANEVLNQSIWKIIAGELSLNAATLKSIFSLNNLKAAALGAAAGFKAMLAAFLPGLILSAVITGLTKIFGLIKDALPTLENARKEAEEAADALSEVQSNIEDLNSTIADLEEQITNLDPITDADEIQKLQDQLTLTKAQLQAEKQLEEVRKKQSESAAKKVLERSDFSENYQELTDLGSKQSIQSYMMTWIIDTDNRGNVQSIEELEAQIDILKTKLEGMSFGDSGYITLWDDIKQLESYRDDYYEVQEGLLDDAEEIIAQYALIESPTDIEIEKYQEAINYLNSQDPSTFLESLFSADDLNQLVDMVNSGTGNLYAILNKYKEDIEEAGLEINDVKEYLKTYAHQLEETGEAEQTAEQQFSSLINTINLLGSQLDQGEIDVEEYVTSVVNNFKKIAEIDLSGVADANSSIVSVLEEVDEALTGLNNKYASGEMDTEEYNDSVVEIIEQLKSLKSLFPQLSDAIDEMLDKDFNMDKFNTLVASDEIADQWEHVNDVLDSVSSEFDNLATVQEMVADGMTITYDEVLKLAKLYPELLQNATLAGEGQMTLNQQVYDQFIKTRQGMLDATIEEQVGELEAQKIVLENKKAALQSELDSVKRFEKGEFTVRELYNKMQLEMKDALTQYLVQLGADEASAQAAIIEAEQGDYKEYTEQVAAYADDLALQMGKAMANAANSTKDNTKSMIESLNSLGVMTNKIAAAFDNMAQGKTSDVSKVDVGGGGIYPTTTTSSASFSSSHETKANKFITVEDLVKTFWSGYGETRTIGGKTVTKKDGTPEGEPQYTVGNPKYIADDFLNDSLADNILDKYFSQLDEEEQKLILNLDASLSEQIATVDSQITQIDSSITALKAVGQYNAKGVYTKEDAKDVDEYTVALKKLRKELEALEKITAAIGVIEAKIELTDDPEEQNELYNQKIELTKQHQAQLHTTNVASREATQKDVDILRRYGFDVDYDAESNNLSVSNWEEKINTIKGKTDEETNEIRKYLEEVFEEATQLVEDATTRSQDWWDDQSDIADTYDKIIANKEQIIEDEFEKESRLRDMSIKEYVDYYDELYDLYKDALEKGYISQKEFEEKSAALGDTLGENIQQKIEDMIKYGEITNSITDEQELGLYKEGKEEILKLYKEGKITFSKAKELILDLMEDIEDKAEEIFDESQEAIDNMIAKLETFSGTQLEVLELYKKKVSEIADEAQRAWLAGDEDYYKKVEADFYSAKSSLVSATEDEYQTVVDAVSYEIDQRIDELNDEKEALETIYDLQDKLIDLREEYATADGDDKEYLKQKIDYLDEQIEIYNSLTTIEEKKNKAAEIEAELGEITLNQLKKKLELTKKTYTQRVWHEGSGWQWEADPTAVAEAEKAVAQQEQENQINAIEAEIDSLEDYKEQWTDVADEYEHAQDSMTAAAVLGENWREQVLMQEIAVLEQFKDAYTTAMTEATSLQFDPYGEFGSESPSTGMEDDSSNYILPSNFYDENGNYNPDMDYSAALLEGANVWTTAELNELARLRDQKIQSEGLTDYYDEVGYSGAELIEILRKKRGYASGGVVTDTALAMLHGSKDSPEVVFNAADSKKLYDLIHGSNDLVQELGLSLPELLGNITNITPNFGSIIDPSIAKIGWDNLGNTTTNTDESTQFNNCSFNIETEANNLDSLINDIQIRIKNR